MNNLLELKIVLQETGSEMQGGMKVCSNKTNYLFESLVVFIYSQIS